MHVWYTLGRISGKITGDRFYRGKFRKAALALNDVGYSVYNPAEIKSKNWHKAMKLAIQKMMFADGVVLLPDWAGNGMWHWVLRNPVLFEKPIPARGSLGLWDYEGELK